MQVFLTGATGFIGQVLTQRLLGRGWQVTALVRDMKSSQAQTLMGLGVSCVVGDVTNSDSLWSAMVGAELVIHNAGHYEYGVTKEGRERMRAVNVLGTANVLDAACRLSIPKTVYVSSVAAYGNSCGQPRDETFLRQAPCYSYYEWTKTEAHNVALRYQKTGLPLVIVCPNAVIGANDHSAWGYTLRLYLNGLKPPFSWSPKSVYSLVDLDDLAEGIALAADRGRADETYFLCGEPLSFRDHLALWHQWPGKFRTRAYVAPAVMAALFAPTEPLQRLLGLPAFASRETVWSAAVDFHYVSDKAKCDFGWNHRSAREMWRKTIGGELALLEHRTKRDVVSRLRPINS